MRLASAECGLELNDGFAAKTADPLERLHKQALHALGHICAVEELHGVLVLNVSLASSHLRKVGRELSLAIAPLGHVGVGLHDVAPAGKRTRRLRGKRHLRLSRRCGANERIRRRRIRRRGEDLAHHGLRGSRGAVQNDGVIATSSHRALLGAIHHVAPLSSDVLGSIGIHSVAEPCHGVERTGGIVV